MEFKTFCRIIAETLGLQVQYTNATKATSVLTQGTLELPKVYIDDWSDHDKNHLVFIAEFYDKNTKDYTNTIAYEHHEEKNTFEHYEIAVSPTGEYDPETKMPIGESQLWQYYLGNSLRRALASYQQGNSRSGRKPNKFY